MLNTYQIKFEQIITIIKNKGGQASWSHTKKYEKDSLEGFLWTKECKDALKEKGHEIKMTQSKNGILTMKVTNLEFKKEQIRSKMKQME